MSIEAVPLWLLSRFPIIEDLFGVSIVSGFSIAALFCEICPFAASRCVQIFKGLDKVCRNYQANNYRYSLICAVTYPFNERIRVKAK